MACRKQKTFLLCVLILFFTFNQIVQADNGGKAKRKNNEAQEKWKKKKVQDYSDADVERLFDQWEDNDEDELEPDELPEWKREQPKIDMSKLDPSNPEGMLKMSKKGKTLMMFATVSGDPSERETEEITKLWHTSLFNAQYDTQRFITSPNRVIFMLSDGSKAWEVKDFLIKQERCEEVQIEGQTYDGAAKKRSADENRTNKKPDKKDKSTKNQDNKIKKQKKTEL